MFVVALRSCSVFGPNLTHAQYRTGFTLLITCCGLYSLKLKKDNPNDLAANWRGEFFCVLCIHTHTQYITHHSVGCFPQR